MNIRRIFQTVVILTLPLFYLNAQDDFRIKRKDFRTDSDVGFREAWRNLQEGNSYFEEGPGTYSIARDYYLQAHQYNSEHPVLNFRLGVCYLYTDDKYEALNYFRKAYDRAPRLSIEMHYLLGRAYHLVLEFDKAIEHYREYKNVLTPAELANQNEYIDKLIQECMNGKSIIENPRRVIVSNLGSSINSAYDDYFPILTSDETGMYFTSRRPVHRNSKRNPYDNKYYENVFYSRLENGVWQPAEFIERLSRKRKNDAPLGISPDGNELYIYRGEKNGGDIFVSTLRDDGEWRSPKRLSSRINSKEFEGAVHITPNNDSMIYISANADLTHGGNDILVATRNEKGRWNHPVNLGSLVNTRYNESSVFLTQDGNDLYFSSRGHNTMGGYDIFHSKRRSDGTWSDPVNIGYPVNTPDDVLYFSLTAEGKHAYYSTIRDGGMGGKDIYMVTFLGMEKEFLLSTEDIAMAGTLDHTRKGFLTTPIKVEIDSFYYLTGRVLDKKTNEPVPARLEFIDLEEASMIATTMTNQGGEFRVRFSQAKTYGIEIKAKDYLFFIDMVNMTEASPDEPTHIDFLLEKIEIGTTVILENIYFETNKATITPASYPQLNQVIELLENNPGIKLEISGHTDNVGTLRLNTKLSEDRARAVVDHLVERGISASRLEWRGYAFSQPIAPNDTPEGRERNRRVEFKVIDL